MHRAGFRGRALTGEVARQQGGGRQSTRWREAVNMVAFDGDERRTAVGSGAGGLLQYREQEASMRQGPIVRKGGRRTVLTGWRTRRRRFGTNRRRWVDYGVWEWQNYRDTGMLY
jgi:hypothetical protein